MMPNCINLHGRNYSKCLYAYVSLFKPTLNYVNVFYEVNHVLLCMNGDTDQ